MSGGGGGGTERGVKAGGDASEDERLAAYARDVLGEWAEALDRDDFGRVRALLSPHCVYRVHADTHEGPDAVCSAYAAAAAWGRASLDALAYDSAVVATDAGADGHGGGTVRFVDHLEHAGQRHTHTCEQRVELGADGLVARIEHRDLPGEPEAVEAWFRRVGLER